jgi:hypothetical protein
MCVVVSRFFVVTRDQGLRRLTSEQNNYLPPHPLILDFAKKDERFGKSLWHPTGKIRYTHPSDGAPHPDVP